MDKGIEALKPGKYAILYRDNWDGEGDTYHTLANLEADGRWLSDETGKELREYVGDEILKAWPLDDGADALQSAPNGMMQLSNELAEMKLIGKWVARSAHMPDPNDKRRVCVYTPNIADDIRYRLVPASLFKAVCSDATHWHYIEPPVEGGE